MNASDFDRGIWRYRARLVRLIDADTPVILADTGFGGRHEVHIRIADLNMPERFTPEGQIATERLRKLLASSPAVEWPLRIVSRQRERQVSEVQSFERYVCDAYFLQSDGSLVSVKEAMAP